MNSFTGSASDQAIAKLKELISSGEFGAGARLPTERELTQRFGISRSSLREGVRALALVGVLEPRVGDGTYVTTLEPDLLMTGIGFVSDLARAGSLLEIHQVRRILEPEATRLATPRLTDEDFVRLEERLRQMETSSGVPAFIEADTQFHRVILDACGNATLSSLIQNLSSGTLRARLWQSLVRRGAVEATLASHWSIYNALDRPRRRHGGGRGRHASGHRRGVAADVPRVPGGARRVSSTCSAPASVTSWRATCVRRRGRRNAACSDRTRARPTFRV